MTPIEKDALAAEYGLTLDVSDEEARYMTEKDVIRILKMKGAKSNG